MADGDREESIDDLEGADWQPGQLIDVRSAEDFAAGHVPGAVNVPLEDVMADPGAHGPGPLHVVCQSGRRSLKATDALLGAGVPAVSVAGGTTAWIESGRAVEHG